MGSLIQRNTAVAKRKGTLAAVAGVGSVALVVINRVLISTSFTPGHQSSQATSTMSAKAM